MFPPPPPPLLALALALALAPNEKWKGHQVVQSNNLQSAADPRTVAR
jgi:hypothetical protein